MTNRVTTKEKEFFQIIYHAFIDDDQIARMTVEGYAVFSVIRRHANKDGSGSFPSYDTLCKRTGMGRARVAKAIKHIVDNKYISLEKTHKGQAEQNHYTVLDFMGVKAEVKKKGRNIPPKPKTAPKEKKEVVIPTPEASTASTTYTAYKEAVTKVAGIVPMREETFSKKIEGFSEEFIKTAYKMLVKEQDVKSKEIYAKCPDKLFSAYGVKINSFLSNQTKQVAQQKQDEEDARKRQQEAYERERINLEKERKALLTPLAVEQLIEEGAFTEEDYNSWNSKVMNIAKYRNPVYLQISERVAELYNFETLQEAAD